MPVERAIKDGKPGFRFGKSGKIYIYTPRDKESRERARKKAEKQGRAVRSMGWKE